MFPIQTLSLEAARDMDIGQPFERQAPKEFNRIPALIARVGIDVFDIEQEEGPGAIENLGQERCLVHFGIRPFEERCHVLQSEL
jgi:hypothetical protein